MKVTLTIETDNYAFEGESLRPELTRILTEQANKVRFYPFDGLAEPFPIKDINGNTVGYFEIEVGNE